MLWLLYASACVLIHWILMCGAILDWRILVWKNLIAPNILGMQSPDLVMRTTQILEC